MTLSYDPLGRLHRVAVGGTATTFLYDPGSGSGAGSDALVAEYGANGALLGRYVHGVGADTPLIWYEGAGLADRRQLYADHQGSIVAIADGEGMLAAINRYDENGIPAVTNVGRFQYTGQIWLAELGMYHYKARIYSPTLGRFLQTDPIGYDDQFNLYAYVGNDPVNRADPTGTTCESVDPQSNRAPRCKIDGVATTNSQGRITGSRPATGAEERRFTAYNNKYSQAYNRLLSRGNREVTVRGFGRRNGEGSFRTTAAKMAEAMRTRQVLYSDRAPRGAAMATSGGPGEGTAPTTYVFNFSLQHPAKGDIAHEIGLHGTPEEMTGGLQTRERPLGDRLQGAHQQPYQDAGCAALGGGSQCD